MAAMRPTISSRKNIDGNSPGPARSPRPTVGDIVASRPTARADLFAIAIVPNRGELVPACYNLALKIVVRRLCTLSASRCDRVFERGASEGLLGQVARL